MAKSVVRGKALVAKLRAQPGVRDAEALAATLGRAKKLRKAGMSAKKALATAGKAASKANNGDGKGSSKPKRITKDEVNAKPWEFSGSQYQIAHGVPQPFIGEISPMQFSRMGKQQKAAYEKKRREEWQASADIKKEWADKVEQAYKDGKISRDTPGLSKDARDVIIRSDINRKEREKAQALDAALQKNNIDSMNDFKIGDRVHTPLYGYGRVLKKNKKTVKIVLLDGNGNPRKNRDGSDMTASVPLKFLQRKKSTEVKAQ